MSIKIMTKVWEAKLPNITSKMVLLKLADAANDDGDCWPSMRSISEACQITKQGIRNQLRKLEKAGFLTVKKGSGRESSEYHVVIPNVERSTAVASGQGQPSVAPEATLSDLRGKPRDLPNIGTVNEPSMNRHPVPETLATNEFLDAWVMWLEHLKQKRKFPTRHTQRLQLSKCEAWGVEKAIETINHSIEKNWQSLFEKNGNRFGREEVKAVYTPNPITGQVEF